MSKIKSLPEKSRGCMLTPKQLSVLQAINRRNTDGSLLDVYQLMEVVGHTATRQAMMFTLGHLESHGLIEHAGSEVRRRQGSQRTMTLLQITEAGKQIIRPRSLAGS